MSIEVSRPLQISKHADLKTREDGAILVLPERAIRLSGSAAEILQLVSKHRSVESILTLMRDRYPDAPEIEDEVLDFLEEMLRLGGLIDHGGHDSGEYRETTS